MLIDNPQVLVDEGWTLANRFPSDRLAMAICTYPTRDREGFEDQHVVATIGTVDDTFEPAQFPTWTVMKKGLDFPENSLRWYLWIWENETWVVKMYRTRDIINDL